MRNNNMNVVEMVLSQAATGRDVIGTLVTVVPDNKQFSVTAIDAEQETVTVTELLPDDSAAVAEVITLSGANARIAHYVRNPHEKPVPDVDLLRRGGKNYLVIDGEKEIFCGQIKVAKVLGAIKGLVLMLAEGANDTFDYVVYDVQNDEFRTEISGFTASEDVRLFNFGYEGALINDRLIVGEEEKDENGSPIGFVDKLKYNNLYKVSRDGSLTLCTSFDDEYDDYEDVEFSVPLIDDMYIVEQAGRRDLVIVSTEGVNEYAEIEPLSKPELNLYRYEDYGVSTHVATYSVLDKNAKVYLGGATGYAPVITVKDKDTIYVTTNRGTLVIDDPEVVETLDGFNIFDGVYSYTTENGESGAKWYYSNKAREEKCFISVNTDRGTLISIA